MRSRTVLREEHGLGPGEDDDFMVRTQEDMTSMRTQTTQTMTGLLASIAGVSLIVGGIGIMNIMLVSVTERTRGDRAADGRSAPRGATCCCSSSSRRSC